MQDIHSIGGRFFAGEDEGGVSGGGGGGGDRLLRPHHSHHHHHHLHHQQGLQTTSQQALKCPRCDSLNTKFCYYNNYNLSQPRHFCKNCRRYWTKGGVLRNVPVGGGCRKTKRSKPKSASSSAAAVAAAASASEVEAPPSAPERKSSNSHSSSESSSLTAANTTEAVSAPPNQESKLFSEAQAAVGPAPNSLADQQGGSADHCSLFSTEIGSFTSLISAPSSVAATATGGGMPLEYGSMVNHHDHRDQGRQVYAPWNSQKTMPTMSVVVHDDQHEALKMQEIAAGSLVDDQTVQADLSVLQDRSNGVGGGFGALGNWQQCGDQGLFDFTNTVDQAYWSQSQWNDQDHPNLYLP